MTMLVSLQQAKDALRFDDDDLDNEITFAIEASSAAVLRYLRLDDDAYADSSGDIPIDSNGSPVGIPPDIQRAVIYLSGAFLRDPSGMETEKWEHGYLPKPVTSLLYPHRDPALA